MRINKFLFACLLVGLLSCVVSQETATAEKVSTIEEVESDADGAIDEAATTEESASATDPNNGDVVVDENEGTAAEAETTTTTEGDTAAEQEAEPVQTGPFVDLFGTQLYSMEMLDETSAQLRAHYTNEALDGKKVVGVYFSADW